MSNVTKGTCSAGGCVAAEPTDGGVLVTSTIEGNEGHVLFTTDEWDTFLADVKVGAWDHTITKAAVPA